MSRLNGFKTAIRQHICPACDDEYCVAWGWVLLSSTLALVSLCGKCARRARYGTAADRRAIAATILRKNAGKGVAA